MKFLHNEKHFTTLLFVLAIAGLAIFSWKTWQDMLPTTGGNFNKILTKVEDVSFYEKTATDFVNNLNLTLDGYSAATTITSDPMAQAFLEQTIGKYSTQTYLKKFELENSTYTVRFYKEQNKRELFISIKPSTQKILGFGEILPENEIRQNLTEEQAKDLVGKFLSSGKIDSSQIELKDYGDTTVQKRKDHYFTYKIKGSEINSKYGEAYITINVNVSGDKISGYNKILFIPEDFSRELSGQLSIGDFLALLTFIITVLVTLASIFIIITAYKKENKIVWKPFLYLFLGLTLLQYFDIVNNFDQLLYYYPTDLLISIYTFSSSLSGLFYGAMFTGLIILAGTAGYYLDKTSFHHKLSNLKDYKMSVLRGYFIAFFTLGVSSIIYYIGEEYFGLWSYGVAENYSVHLSAVPLLAGLYMALTSSISEEIIFRYFGFLFIHKYIKSIFIATLLATLVWAFGHSNYPVFPVYFRGIELLIGGVIWMYFVLRYNILTTTVAHFVFNATLFAVPLFLSTGFNNVASGLILILFPFIILIGYDGYRTGSKQH